MMLMKFSLKLLMVKWFILIGNYTVWELWNSIGGGRLRKIKLYYMKHFTILEVTDSESQMIGTILNVTDDADSIGNFKSRLLTAIQVHFDTDDYRHDEIPDMFSGSPYDDLVLKSMG
jgi:hypothetical protein